MAKSRSASVKQERSTSPPHKAVAVKVEVKGEDDDVAKLFDDGVKPEADEPEHVKVEARGGEDVENDGEDGVKGDESVTLVAEVSSSRGSSKSTSASASPHPHAGGSDRPSTTPPIETHSHSKHKTNKAKVEEVQLIGDLPRAEEEAMKVFVEIEECHYQYGTLGRSREALESMTCDCQYDHGVDDPEDACGHDSDCINRLTQVECMPGDCRCGGYCKNQRFQRKDYAPIHIVKTEKKGFGLRAAEDLRKDTFIYEYVGDVVNQPSFYKRMRQYADEGIRHFYFMMLQKDEFIDATKRGGIGRFANHSCNPNCYVAKWTVGDKVRMGIFAKRNVKKDEELTFNYNVDRYGHDAQPCYCGEPNCVGFIGGKTQTDIAAMDDLCLDALGITDEVERLGLKGSKKKKGKKLDEDFVPDMKPLSLKDVHKVVQAMRQTQSRKILLKLLTRIRLTEDQTALRQIMRLRGFSIMTNVLEDYATDVEICSIAIECMMTWPLIQRNKVEDSKVGAPVKACAQSENVVLAELATKLLAQWETLEYAYRIPKRLKGESDDLPKPPAAASTMPVYDEYEDWRPPKRSRYADSDDDDRPKLDIKPLGFFGNLAAPPVAPQVPSTVSDTLHKLGAWQTQTPYVAPEDEKTKLERIIAEATAAAEAEKARQAEEAAAEAEKKAEKEAARAARKAAKRDKHKGTHQTQEEKEANKEKKLLKLVGAVVVKCMSKYQDKMDHETFKKHAKELTHVIAEKEKKSHSYKEGKLDSLSEEKVTKIKKFAKEYIAKVLRKMQKGGHRDRNSSTSQAAASTSAVHSPESEAGSPFHDQDIYRDDGDDPRDSPSGDRDEPMDVDHGIESDAHQSPHRTRQSPPPPNGSERAYSPEAGLRHAASTTSFEEGSVSSHAERGTESRRHHTMDVDQQPERRSYGSSSQSQPQSRSRNNKHRPDGAHHRTSEWRDSGSDPRMRHRKEEFGWDPDRGAPPANGRSLLERIQPLRP